jgi:hypothetical protein
MYTQSLSLCLLDDFLFNIVSTCPNELLDIAHCFLPVNLSEVLQETNTENLHPEVSTGHHYTRLFLLDNHRLSVILNHHTD